MIFQLFKRISVQRARHRTSYFEGKTPTFHRREVALFRPDLSQEHLALWKRGGRGVGGRNLGVCEAPQIHATRDMHNAR